MTQTKNSRPAWKSLGVATAALLVLAGCSTSEEPASGESAVSDSLLPEAEGQTEYPLSVETWAGESTIEERPERIAVVGFSTNLDLVQAIDVVPTSTITEDVDYAWRDRDWYSSIDTIHSSTRRDDINVEAIAGSDPDVIIAFNSIWDEDVFERLETIAPVLDYSTADELGDKADWRDAQLSVGEALDLREAAQTAIDESDAAVTEERESHPEFAGKSITVATEYGANGGLQFYNPAGSTAEGLLTDLGFEPSPYTGEFVDDPVIADENLSNLDADVLVIIYSNDEERERRESSALLQGLPAVQDGRYISLTNAPDDPTLLLTPDGDEKENVTWVLRRGASAESVPWAFDVLANQWFSDIDR